MRQTLIIECERLELSNVQFHVDALMPTKLFSEIMAEMNQHGTKTRIGIGRDKTENWTLTFTAENDTSSMRIEIPRSGIDLEMNSEREFSLHFTSKVLNTVGKTCSISDTLLLQMAMDGPLSVMYRLERNVGCFLFYVAPLIEESDQSDED